MRLLPFVAKAFRCLFCWSVRTGTDAELSEAQAIMAQSFGFQPDGLPGRSNDAMGEIAAGLIIRSWKRIPAILQHEIAGTYCWRGMPIAMTVERNADGSYLDTFQVLSRQAAFCQDNGIEKVILIAHPHHMWRCMMVARRLGLEVVVPDVSAVPYDPLSAQWWTRNAWLFMPREIAARLLYLLKGWI